MADSSNPAMAIADNGKPEATHSANISEVLVLPAGPANVVTAASTRLIYWRRPGNEMRPIRVRTILRPGTRRNPSRFPVREVNYDRIHALHARLRPCHGQ